MLQYINIGRLLQRVEADAASFASAKPFKHIVFDDLLVPGCSEAIAAAFPRPDWSGWANNDHQFQRLKSSCSTVGTMPVPIDRVVMELNAGETLAWIEKLTGIANLLPDPYLEGGGLHTSFAGGYLVPHTDFHVTPIPNYFRRLNLLLYLNPEWHAENGGSLELWNKGKDTVVREVPPVLGQCVIFQTDDDSVHGFSKAVTGRPQRNSIAMYYYTSVAPDRFSGDGNTYWRMQSLEGRERQTWGSIQRRRFFYGVARVASSISWRASRLASATNKKIDQGSRPAR